MKPIPKNNPILYRVADEVTDFHAAYEIIKNMVDVMARHGGIGLAAPQVGISQRIIVITNPGKTHDNNMILSVINPKLALTGGTHFSREGCLSFPGYEAKIKRYDKAVLTGRIATGGRVVSEITLTGLAADIIQHEVDHLNGKVIWRRR